MTINISIQYVGVHIFENSELGNTIPEAFIVDDLKRILTGLAKHLFGEEVEMRWNEDSFPFTHPSFELEVMFNGKWMEVLGCGVIHEEVAF